MKEKASAYPGRSIYVRNGDGDWWTGGRFEPKKTARALRFSSIMAAYADARPAGCAVTFWIENEQGEWIEVFE
jgi:hypothetical protein